MGGRRTGSSLRPISRKVPQANRDSNTVTTLTDSDARCEPGVISFAAFSSVPLRLNANERHSQIRAPPLQPSLQGPEAIDPLIQVVSADPKVVPTLFDKAPEQSLKVTGRHNISDACRR